MKKEIKTYEELLKCDGKNFEGMYNGKKIFGTISIKDKIYFYPCEDSKKRLDFQHFEARFTWMKDNFLRLEDNNFIYNIYVEVEEEWTPKFGELVFIPEIKENRIFLFEKDGMFACVGGGEDEKFKKNYSFDISFWKDIRKIEEPKQVEISLDEAKKIIAESKKVSVEQINLNFKID